MWKGAALDINTIAKLAGVSRATVSRYLNNGYVSQEKREVIARVIDETGYVPSSHARTMRTGKTNLVGVVIPKLGSESVSRMVEGMSITLQEGGYQVVLANTYNDESSEPGYLRILGDSTQVDGLILIATIFTRDHLEAMAGLRVPLVVVGQQLDGYSCVHNDDYRAVYEVTQHVLHNGARPAFIGVTERDVAAGAERHRGFSDACAAAGINPENVPTATSEFTLDSGYLAAEKLLDLDAEIDTIVCASDTIALGALTCLREYGRRVPEDVQVTGIGDSEMASVVTPTLTTVRHHYHTCGKESARMLMDAMTGEDVVAREMRVGHDLMLRNSTR